MNHPGLLIYCIYTSNPHTGYSAFYCQVNIVKAHAVRGAWGPSAHTAVIRYLASH